MARRLDIELTSSRDDGSWTWRAAGAREPRGALDGSLLPGGVKVGDTLRVEADFDLDGVTIISVLPSHEKKRNEPERLELIGRPQRDDELVTSTLNKDRSDRPRRDRGDRDRGDRGGPGKRTERTERGDRPRRPRPEGAERPPRDRPPREKRPEGERPNSEGPNGERKVTRTRERRPPRPRPEEPPKPKPKRLRPGRTHRNAVLAELPPEHRPIAEQVLKGDIPAVRQAIDKENEARAAKGEPAINGDDLLTLAEQLRPRLRTAEWHDRAEAALADVDELDLRDLRSVVVAADSAARDDTTRALAADLRNALAKRVEAEQQAWIVDLTGALRDGRVVRALRLSSRPPKAGALLPPDLSSSLRDAANAALTADAAPDRWEAVLDATAHSPVRLAVEPQSKPDPIPEPLTATVTRFADRVPKVAAAFGIEPPATPPRPPRSRGPKKPPAPPPKPPPQPPSAPQAEQVEQVEGTSGDDVAVEG